MFGECHAHLFMNGYDYKKAKALHSGGAVESEVRNYLSEYQRRQVRFVRDGGDALGVSALARGLAPEYGIDYRTPVFAIHRNGRYGGIVGRGFDTMVEYAALVREAKRQRADFIKIMVSGIVDFSRFGVITSSPLTRREIFEMVYIAHEEGFAVMVHANGAGAVRDAAEAGAESIEHGRYIDEAALKAMAEHHTVWVPTLVTVKNLLGDGRFPDTIVGEIYASDVENVTLGRNLGVQLALGSDAGAYRVPHGQGIVDEYHAFQEIFGASDELDAFLKKGEVEIARRFCFR